MKLLSFKVKSFTRKDNIAKLYKFGDWNMKHPENRKEFFYTITSDDGTEYDYHCYRKPLKIKEGDKVNSFYSDWKGNGRKVIKYHSLYGTFFSERELQKAISDYVGRHQKNIDWEQSEIKRLESLR